MSIPGALPVSLSDFLAEADLSHLCGVFRTVLKVDRVDQLKQVSESDLQRIGMSSSEQRRLKKSQGKYFAPSYLGRFVKILHSKTSSSVPSSRRNSGVDQWSDGSSKWKDKGQSLVGSQSSSSSSNAIIPINNIAFQEVISKDSLDSVQRALWVHSSHTTDVVVKKRHIEWRRIEEAVLADALLLRSIEHACLARFYGVVLESESVVYTVTEYASNHSLLDCLRDSMRKSSLTVLVLCDMASQIADGMRYLEQRSLYHGNLAARNVLMFQNFKLKVGDVSFPHGAPHRSELRTTTYAWLAPECYFGSNYTTASDVWAFGVTLWEMFSFGAQPFAGFTDQQIREIVDQPYFRRLEQPDWCPRDYFELMRKCWNHSSTDRITFKDLYIALADCKPEQVQVVTDIGEDIPTTLPHDQKLLQSTVGDVIVVLDNNPHDGNGLWKGVIENRKAGLFDPSNTVTYLGTDSLPSIPLGDVRSSLKGLGKQKLNRSLISRPQNDFRHVGHVGLDSNGSMAHFGDVSMLLTDNQFGSISSLSRPSSRTPLSDSRVSSASSLATPETGSSRSTPEQQKVSHNGRVLHNGFNGRTPAHISTRSPTVPDGVKNRTLPAQTTKFQLDLGPSLMDEVFRAFNNNCSFAAVPTSNCSSEVLSDKTPLTFSSEPSTPSDPISPSHLTLNAVQLNDITTLQVTTKPCAPPRKRSAPTPLSLGLKPVNSRDEKVLDSFINMNNHMAIKREPSNGEQYNSSPSLQTGSSLKSRFFFRALRNKIGASDTLPPPSPRTPSARTISRPMELNELITDDAKEAYRALVEEGQRKQAAMENHSVPAVADTESVPDRQIQNEEVVDDGSSPLKLLRRGAGSALVYKGSSASRFGRPAAGGFARSVSHEPTPMKLPVPEVNHVDDNSQSFREFNGNVGGFDVPILHDVVSAAKKSDRAAMPPPPLPPRDRSKPALPSTVPKPRERKYPLILPGSDVISSKSTGEPIVAIATEVGLSGEMNTESPVVKDEARSGQWKKSERECSF